MRVCARMWAKYTCISSHIPLLTIFHKRATKHRSFFGTSHIPLLTCVYTCTHICTYVSYSCVFIHVHTYVCLCISIYVCIYMYLYIYTCIYTCIHICIYICIHRYMCICNHMHPAGAKNIYVQTTAIHTHFLPARALSFASSPRPRTPSPPYIYMNARIHIQISIPAAREFVTDGASNPLFPSPRKASRLTDRKLSFWCICMHYTFWNVIVYTYVSQISYTHVRRKHICM